MTIHRRSFLARALRAVFNRVCPIPEPMWRDVPARRPYLPQQLGTVLADIDCRLPATGVVSSATYRSSDYCNWAHEATHGVNSMVRNWRRGGWNAFYCLHGRAAELPEPRLTLACCARYVPTRLRALIYQQYMLRQQADWNDCPLYIFDEWVAYTNGTLATIEQLDAGRSIGGGSHTLRFMIESAVNALAVAVAVDAGRNYAHRDRLYQFFTWHWQRMLEVMAAAEKHPKMHSAEPYEHYQLLAESDDRQLVALRDWCRRSFGAAWVTQVMAFA